jgi:hypothetical protein
MQSKPGMMFRLAPLVAIGGLVLLAACADDPPPPQTVTHSTYTKTITANPAPVDPATGMVGAPNSTTTQSTTYNSQNTQTQ